VKIFILLLSALFVISAHAKTTSQDCPATTEEKYGTSVTRIFYSDIGLCSIAISPRNAWQTLTYRDYSIASNGLFLVFNSYGSAGSFSAREFMLFPRSSDHISYSWNDATREIQVQGASNDIYTFDANTGQLKSISGAKSVTVGPVNRNNNGGVEIKGYQGQLLDIGYTAGQAPSQSPDALSKYINSNSTCRIKNSAIFDYLTNGDVQFKFDNDKSFNTAIKAQCK